jgi:hypothetical protein
MHADAERLVHRADRFGLQQPVAVQRLAVQNAGAVAEHAVADFRFRCQRRQRAAPVRDVEMPAGGSVAIDAADHLCKIVETLADFSMQAQRGGLAPPRDPLAAAQPPRGVLALPAIARAAAPGDAVGLQHRRLDTEIARQRDGAVEASIAGADDGDVHILVTENGAVIRRRRPGGGDPVSRRVVAPGAGVPRPQRVVARIIGGMRRMLRVQHGRLKALAG